MPKHLPPFYTRLRFATAAVATWVLNLGMFGSRFKLMSACSPGLNCHGCAWASAACPVGAIAYGSAVHALPVFAIASVLAIGAIFGRLVCSFACPFGFLQDLMHKIPSRKFRLPQWIGYGKYLALLLLVIVIPYLLGFDAAGYLKVDKPAVNKNMAGRIEVIVTVTNLGAEPVSSPQLNVVYRALTDSSEIFRQSETFPDLTVAPGQTIELPMFEVPNLLPEANLAVDSPQSVVNQNPRWQLYYCKLCPAGTLTAALPSLLGAESSRPLLSRAAAMSVRLGILAAFLVLFVITSRPMCRGFCPLGAMYALTARLSLSGMKIDAGACVDCGLCNKVCPMELDVRTQIGGGECIACGDCMKVCAKNGIHRRFM